MLGEFRRGRHKGYAGEVTVGDGCRRLRGVSITCPVRLLAIKYDVSVRSFHVPPTPGLAWPPVASVTTSGHARDLAREGVQTVHIVVMVSFSSGFDLHVHVILRDRSRGHPVVTSRCFHLGSQVAGHGVDRSVRSATCPHARHKRPGRRRFHPYHLACHACECGGE